MGAGQQHSADHYRKAVEIVQSGRLGRISEVKAWDYINHNPGFGAPPDSDPPAELDWDFWLGPSPKVPYNPNRYAQHYWFFDYGGSWQTDWAVHHYDIVHWAMGTHTPLSAYAARGHFCFDDDNREWPDMFSGILEYGPCTAADKGFIMQYTAVDKKRNSSENCSMTELRHSEKPLHKKEKADEKATSIDASCDSVGGTGPLR